METAKIKTCTNHVHKKSISRIQTCDDTDKKTQIHAKYLSNIYRQKKNKKQWLNATMTHKLGTLYAISTWKTCTNAMGRQQLIRRLPLKLDGRIILHAIVFERHLVVVELGAIEEELLFVERHRGYFALDFLSKI